MEWKVLSELPLYSDDWLDIRVADVELPDGRQLAHRVVRVPLGAGVVAEDGTGQVLLIWRHRFITGTWGWEIPMGRVEDGETPAQTAAREFEEETGWRAGPLRHLLTVRPTPGISDSEHHVYRASEATRLGRPADANEADRVDWVPLSEIRPLIAKGEISSGTTLAALLYVAGECAAAGSG